MVPQEKLLAARERAARLIERAREVLHNARNTRQVTACRRALARLEAKKTTSPR